MLRFLTQLLLVLLVTMVAPAGVWAGQDMPGGIELVGPSCCASALDTDAEPSQSQLEKACCCSPSPKSASSFGSQLGTPLSNSILVPAAAAEASTRPRPATTRMLNTENSARAPPLRRTLLAQRTSLVI